MSTPLKASIKNIFPSPHSLHPSIRLHTHHLSTSASTSDQQPKSKSAAAHLLEQALLEEQEESENPRKEPVIPELRERAWDGDEPQERALRRILSDQYKPIRIKGFKKPIPAPAPLPNRLFDESAPPPAASTLSSDPTKPKHVWDFTFVGPTPSINSSFSSSSITHANLPPLQPPRLKTSSKRARLHNALEAKYDYASGHTSAKPQILVPDENGETHPQGQQGHGGWRRPMGGMRAWNGLVEDRIEQARKDGLFNNLKGRGKPMVKDAEEGNPYIGREEFLMNRIVVGQGVAPPWVEMQVDLETALSTFRTTLRDSWTRRTLRTLSLGGVSNTSISTVLSPTYRDKEWEARESKFHEVAVGDLNSKIRSYNVVAPYAGECGGGVEEKDGGRD
ncbi:DnaJ family protein [Pseudohyphozyma bogoriensis]|nr:DnaJ family protein [Pseudohyphozyma bogoriensis]